MIVRHSVWGVAYVLAFAGVLCATESPVTGTMSVNGKKYTLSSSQAYRVKSEGRDAIAVILSSKPIKVKNSRMFPPQDAQWIDVRSIEMLPHIQIIFDPRTKQPMSYQGWADNITFAQKGLYPDLEPLFTGKATLSDSHFSGSVRVTGKQPPPPATSVELDCQFEASVKDLPASEIHQHR